LRERSLKLDNVFLLEVDDMLEGKEHASLERFPRPDQSEWLLSLSAWT